MARSDRPWVDDVEIENAQIKWVWSHFDGRRDTFNEEGKRGFQLIITEKDEAMRMANEGWPVREMEPYEEGDEPEYLLKVNISFKYDPPKIMFIKAASKRKMLIEDEKELSNIRRQTVEKINVVITPSFWEQPGGKKGISAYVKELYVFLKPSRFGDELDDYETV